MSTVGGASNEEVLQSSVSVCMCGDYEATTNPSAILAEGFVEVQLGGASAESTGLKVAIDARLPEVRLPEMAFFDGLIPQHQTSLNE